MAIKKTKSRRVFEVLNALFMMFLMLITIYPILYIISASFSEPSRFLVHSGLLWKPLGFTLIAYEKALVHPQIMHSYLNTIMIVVGGVFVSVILTALGAYFLTRKNVMLQKPLAFLIIFTMFFSGGLIPFYFTVKDVGLLDNLLALILPTAINTFNLIIMRTGFAAIPDSLEESARIDGAGHITILYRIVLPLAMPTIAVMVLYYGVSQWNSWFNAMIFIDTADKWPLQLVLRQILVMSDTQSMMTGMDAGSQMAVSETIKYAVIVISTLPILLVYPFLQKYFVKGVMVGAVKG